MQVDYRVTDEDSSTDGDAEDPAPALSHRVTGILGLASQEEIKITSSGRSYLSSAITIMTSLWATQRAEPSELTRWDCIRWNLDTRALN